MDIADGVPILQQRIEKYLQGRAEADQAENQAKKELEIEVHRLLKLIIADKRS